MIFFFFLITQAYVFHVEKHPQAVWFEQCVTFNAFSSEILEMVYNVFVILGLCALPLVTIIFCYLRILFQIQKANNSHTSSDGILIRMLYLSLSWYSSPTSTLSWNFFHPFYIYRNTLTTLKSSYHVSSSNSNSQNDGRFCVHFFPLLDSI